ncbi:MAG: MFS transporter [Halioglobus sp.]|nr:MFS transporter [Halioglobus sp.]|tara:strand:- start:7 stop:1329 length:1323 start_codon:yes stop_codon:yes gene_type:complete
MPSASGARVAHPVSKRELVAWAFYDFANSGYTTVVLTTVYSAYFVAVVAASLDATSPGSATLAWTLSIAAANLVVLLGGPVIGAVADHRAMKKPFLFASSVLCIASTALLAATGPDSLYAAMALLVLSAIAFAAGENLIAAFLPEISSAEGMGRISGFGWSLGYFGGLLTLGVCLGYVSWAEGRGLPATHYVPATLLITAGIFAVTAAPTFVWLRERAEPRAPLGGTSYLRMGFRQVALTLRHAAHLPDLFRFLFSLTLFQAGVATVVVIAAIYAQEVMGFSSQQLITLIMVVNLTAAVGAFLFGYAQDHFGSVPSLTGALVVWIAAIGVAYFSTSPGDVWLAGNLIGLAMGATQAGGRALIGRLTPARRNAEIFGLWGLANRAAAIIGPISYGLISEASGGDHKMALLSTGTFFLAGMVLLLTVDERRGMAAARAAAAG